MEYTRELFTSIENRNKEFNAILNGAEYNKGLQINNIRRIIKSFAIGELIEVVRCKLMDRKMKIKNVGNANKTIPALPETFDSYRQFQNRKIVVYTCIIGKYDQLKEPLMAFDNVTYICFTDDQANIDVGENTKWEICRVPEHILTTYEGTLANRYVKMHPHELFPDADYSVYVDGNVKIVSFPGAYLSGTKGKAGIAIFAHGQRNCAYDEAQMCIIRKKGKKEFIERQMQRYHEEGFPINYGLYECTIIATDLSNEDSRQILEAWWQEFMESKSFRDQLSLPYVMWKKGFQYTDIGLLGANIFDDCKITVYSHS